MSEDTPSPPRRVRRRPRRHAPRRPTRLDWASRAAAIESHLFDDEDDTDLESQGLLGVRIPDDLDEVEQYYVDRELSNRRDIVEQDYISHEAAEGVKKVFSAPGVYRAAEVKLRRDGDYEGAKSSWFKWLAMRPGGLSKTDCLLLAEIYAEEGNKTRAETVIGWAEEFAAEEPPIAGLSRKEREHLAQEWRKKVNEVKRRLSDEYNAVLDRYPDSDPPFWLYVGTRLAQALPYRRKMLLFGPPVCEREAVLPMAKSGFFLGCALSLADSSKGEEALETSVGFSDWKAIYQKEVEDLRQRVSRAPQSSTAYEALYPESAGLELLTPREAERVIAKQVFGGIVFGIRFPDIGKSMLETWIQQPHGWERLSSGGLSVNSSPQLNNVGQAQQIASSLYDAWRQDA